MKKINVYKLVICSVLVLSCFFSACRKNRDYHIHGYLINEVTGTSEKMGGELVQLIRQKYRGNEYSLRNNRSAAVVSKVVTDANGHYDFGIQNLPEGEYTIDYPQLESKDYVGLKNSFEDFELGAITEVKISIAIIPCIRKFKIIAKPLTTSSVHDTIFVGLTSKKNYEQNPTYQYYWGALAYDISMNSEHIIGSTDNRLFMGDIYIKLYKSYNGNRSVFYDTVYVAKDETYTYYTQF